MRHAIAAVLLIIALAGAAHATKLDPGPRPGTNDINLDCSNAAEITCGEIQTHAVGPGPGNVEFYGCTGLSYDNAMEFVYELCIGGNGGQVDLTMTYSHVGGSNDLDLFLLGSCEENNCLDASLATSGIETITANLSPGMYYVVVDAWIGLQDGSPHTLTVNCQAPCATPVEPATWGAIKALHN